MRKHICQTCGQEFSRFWNMKRHLLTMHPDEYAHWNLPNTDNNQAGLTQPHRNNLYKHNARANLGDMTNDVFESAWRRNVYNEIRSIKNGIHSIKFDLLAITKILLARK